MGEKSSSVRDNILNRTGDVIQMNISQAGDASNLKHQKGKDFQLKNACTYVSVEANVKADMLFMNMDFFQNNLETYGGVVETDSEGNGLEKITTFKYKGLYGY